MTIFTRSTSRRAHALFQKSVRHWWLFSNGNNMKTPRLFSFYATVCGNGRRVLRMMVCSSSIVVSSVHGVAHGLDLTLLANVVMKSASVWAFRLVPPGKLSVDCVWNVMARPLKQDFVFRRNGRVHLSRWGRQCGRLLAAEVCVSAVVMMDKPCSQVVWRVLATHFICQFPLHFPSLRHRVPAHLNWTLLLPNRLTAQ